jgi:hypothetical protein
MYEFLDRLVSVALPRVRDFRGVSQVLRRAGNFASVSRSRSSFRRSCRQDRQVPDGHHHLHDGRDGREAKALLTHLGVPFRE